MKQALRWHRQSEAFSAGPQKPAGPRKTRVALRYKFTRVTGYICMRAQRARAREHRFYN